MPSDLTDEDIARLRELLENERVWPAPWVAHTFEIDCPCPNGSHCGDSHTCEEVESREAYPCGEPGNPADVGDGQCVVQISVPGIETFAKPTAEFIAAIRNAAPELLSAYEERARYREALERIATLECSEDHDASESACPKRIARAALEPKR